jgi:hypothetical protein
MLDFAEQTGSGIVIVVWSFLTITRLNAYTYSTYAKHHELHKTIQWPFICNHIKTPSSHDSNITVIQANTEHSAEYNHQHTTEQL